MNNLYLKQAIRGIKSNPSRTFLTMLGIVIGIGTVIMVLGAGEGFKSYINSQVEAYGSNTIFIETSVPSSTKQRSNSNENNQANSSANSAVPITTLKVKDLNDIKVLPNVKGAYGVAMGQEIASHKNKSKNVFVMGASSSRFDIDKGKVETGRPFTEEEERSLAQVAVLGYDLVEDIFDGVSPIGKLIKIGNYNFEVVGVYEKRGSAASFTNDDEQIYIPITTLQKKILGVDYLFYAVIEVYDNDIAKATVFDIEDVLRRNHYINDSAKDDFKVSTQAQALSTFEVILKAITFLLIAIASISLIVGGVGVMNIMYVVVTERIGEIGLKKALGATNKNILYDFLIEAVILTSIGGIIGIIFGALLTFAVSGIARHAGLTWDFVIPVGGVIGSVSVSMIIGVVFGVFPARNASKLDPIVALNRE